MSSFKWPPSGSGGGGGVSSLNTLTGDLTLAAGTGISITPSGGNTLTIANTAPVFTAGDLTDVGTDGITITGGTSAVNGAGTSIAQHVSDATHNGYLSSSDWTTFNSKQAAGSYLTALTGDGTATGPGSASLTLATVNANVGSFGSSTAIPNFTVNGKGLLTAAGTNVVIAPAGTLTGTTLAANVVSSSLTSVGTIATGVWNGTSIAVANGGTSLATLTANNVILGNGTSAPLFVAPGSSGNVLTSNGTTWTSAVAASGGITQLTGDVTAGPGSGSQAATLATVNANVGSFGSSTSIPNFTVNAKGLITAAGGNVVIAPAGTLSGTTLNSTVVSSSLTSVGTIATGVWNGTAINETHGGTNQTTYTTGDLLYASGANTLSKLPVGANGDYLTVTGGVPAYTSVSPGNPFDSFVSSAVTTGSSAVTSGTFTTFSNSPAFTFTPNFNGTYKVYCAATVDCIGVNNEMDTRIFNTSGGAILLAESFAEALVSTTEIILSGFIQSTYTLTSGVSYVFDIQGRTTGGSITLFGGVAQFYMFAERIG